MTGLAARVLISATVAIGPQAASQVVVTPDLLLRDYASSMLNIPEVTWLPDGSALLFAAEARRLRTCTPSPTAPTNDDEIWIATLDVKRRACRLLVQGRRPRPSPDGLRIAFVAGDGVASRIAVTGITGDGLRHLSEPSGGLASYFSDFAWSPDGSRIAYGFRPDPPARAPAPTTSTVRVIGGDGDLPPDSEIWSVTVSDGERRQLWRQAAQFTDFEWFPDGRALLFVARGGPEYRTNGFSAEIRVLDMPGGSVRTVVKDAGVQLLRPDLSPDGRRLGFNYDPNNIFYPYFYRAAIRPVAGGPIRTLTDSLWVRLSPRWGPDNSTLFFGGKPGAFTHIFCSDGTGVPKQITRGPREVHQFALSADGRSLAWVALDPYGRMEIRSASSDGSGERVLLDFTAEISALRLAPVEEIRWKSKDGLQIVGLLIKPLNHQPGRRAPLIVDLHGGPLGGVGFAGRVLLTSPLEWQMWAARGFAVLHPDYRSSGIYGWDVLIAMREKQDDAERDFDDVMSGVDHVIGAGVADPSRLAIIGHSAGAIRTNWIVTHTHRFKAAVSYEGAADMALGYGTAMVGGNPAIEWHYRGRPWDVPEHYRQSSPLNFVKGVRTPTMFVSGEQGIALFHNQALFTAWKVQGVPTEFLVYGGEGHVIANPANQRDLLTRVIGWIDKWLAPLPVQ
jgi:dipeptidyl aminopeptidase/acylaminoacyl peptidase